MSLLRHSWVLGLVGLVGVVAFGSIWFVSGQITTIAQILGLMGAGSLGAWAFLDRDRIRAGASAREVFASASAAMVVLMGGLLAVLLVGVASEYDRSTDLSRDGRYALSSRSLGVVDGLTEPVTVYGLFRNGSPDGEQVGRLGRLLDERSDQLTYEAIDPLLQPARARAVVQTTGNMEMDRLSMRGTIVLSSGSRRRRIESRFDEEAITNALVKLTSGEDRRVCWSVGHGERDPDDDQDLHGWGVTVLRLEDRNAVVTEQRILTAGVDRSCDALVIAGPSEDFLPHELAAIAGYVAEGGQVAIFLDNPLVEGVDSPSLTEELERYGIAVGLDVIVENDQDHVAPDPIAGEPLQVYGHADFKNHPILDPLPTGVAVHWPRSVQATDNAPGIEVRELVASSQRSWAETNPDPGSGVLPQPDPDEQLGPVPMAVLAEVLDPSVLEVSVEPAPEPDTDVDDGGPPVPLSLGGSRRSLVPSDLAPKPGGRVFVIGDADLGGNALTSLLDNGDAILNTVSFLLGEEDQLGVDADDSETLTLSASRFAIQGLLSVALLPLAAVIIGVILLVRRRFL